ncbi:hypothetical protein [Flavobacterium caseinilyticum]|uniref:Uncharacterized protein n=1 Tax=Flavobacterium caseinilyticum TaxID=2541732 RepID=A0A4R5B510_9FLAO|nr:hypothetical protein [Flavobacterium caseinilyticum]TDD78704.1 hypothetical protein E0F89_03475 [Flavobacterium caseinilyticum]
MELNKLDLEIKQKLEQRIIQPSAQAWDRLETMLDSAEKTKSKRNINWIYIAASFVGFLLVCTVFFNGYETVKIDPTAPIVLEEKSDENNLEKPEMLHKDVVSSQIQKTITKEYKVVAENNNVNKQSKKLNTKEEKFSNGNRSRENEVVVIVAENKNYQSISSNRYVSAEKLLAEVSNTKFESKITDLSVAKARKAISVNPNSLLSSAETELNQSFRESALDKFNKNFNAIKTVLVNRNYEE